MRLSCWECRRWSQVAWVRIPPLPLPCNVTLFWLLTESFHALIFWSVKLSFTYHSITYLWELLQRLNEFIFLKYIYSNKHCVSTRYHHVLNEKIFMKLLVCNMILFICEYIRILLTSIYVWQVGPFEAVLFFKITFPYYFRLHIEKSFLIF